MEISHTFLHNDFVQSYFWRTKDRVESGNDKKDDRRNDEFGPNA